MSEPCSKEKEINQINTEIFGKDGIIRTIPRLEGKIDNLVETVNLLCTNVSAVMKYVAGEQGVELYKEKQGLTARQWTAIYVSGIVGFSGIICSIILKLL